MSRIVEGILHEGPVQIGDEIAVCDGRVYEIGDLFPEVGVAEAVNVDSGEVFLMDTSDFRLVG